MGGESLILNTLATSYPMFTFLNFHQKNETAFIFTKEIHLNAFKKISEQKNVQSILLGKSLYFFRKKKINPEILPQIYREISLQNFSEEKSSEFFSQKKRDLGKNF